MFKGTLHEEGLNLLLLGRLMAHQSKLEIGSPSHRFCVCPGKIKTFYHILVVMVAKIHINSSYS
jgi:hypothetical protein